MIGLVIPDRQDRPMFLENCLRMIKRQTMQDFKLYLINHKPTGPEYDLTLRVRQGYEQAKADGCECVLIIENDDWYSPIYVAKMYREWIKADKPTLLGIDTTIYYHVRKRGFRELSHGGRSSLFCTLISCSAEISWCEDKEIFLDIHLWKNHRGVLITPKKPICLGIKHGIGKLGGGGHTRMYYPENDQNYEYLSAIVDKSSLALYQSI